MALERLQVTNLVNWGNLVKSWATGVNRLGDGNNYPVPWTDLQAFKDQCAMAGVGATIPSYVHAVQLVQTPVISTLLLRLPARELVLDSEQILGQPNARYTIPEFYNRIFNVQVSPIVPPADSMRVHAERIGDYTLSNCM
jgi:hypothetical protein